MSKNKKAVNRFMEFRLGKLFFIVLVCCLFVVQLYEEKSIFVHKYFRLMTVIIHANSINIIVNFNKKSKLHIASARY